MFRPVCKVLSLSTDHPPRKGYTLVEILTATVLSLLLLVAVIQMFSRVGESITESRSMLEAADRLRSAVTLLQKDLSGITVKPTDLGLLPPVRPEEGQGYLEIIEGPIMQTKTGVHPNILHDTSVPPPPSPYPVPVDRDRQSTTSANRVRFTENGLSVIFNVDTSAGDFDDTLQFTTRSKDRPFRGRCFSSPNGVMESDVAEVAWFVRGRTLYRRVLLVAPAAVPVSVPLLWNTPNYYASYDISSRVAYDAVNDVWRLIPNTLSDLTRRESRFAHPVYAIDPSSNPIYFPYDNRAWRQLRLPTLLECSFPLWYPGWYPAELSNQPDPSGIANWPPTTDFWRNLPVRDPGTLSDPTDTTNPAHPANPDNYWIRFSNPYFERYAPGSDPYANYPRLTIRYSEDVVLENVIGFDVKVWDDGAPLFLVAENTATGKLEVVDPSKSLAGLSPQTVSLNEIPYDPSNPTDTLDFSYAIPGCSGAYVDLGYWEARFPSIPNPTELGQMGSFDSGLSARLPDGTPDPRQARVYDTWSTHYENVGRFPGDTTAGRFTNGFDDDNSGIVDDVSEMIAPPPYFTPLRGIQVKIRIFEPDSRQPREVTVVQDFLPQ